ncbi:hypothetical protein BZL39_G06490 [Zygosaccharomyces parabailii]|nr:hypothetical protein BZL39_G06490 [Zygosaccharomyces parabailii]CDH13212.1 probable Repressible acid phosphatase [Zygosaccharomyces bailii ISA1307]
MLSAVISILLTSQGSNALYIPQGKNADVSLIGTQEKILPYLAGSGPYFQYQADYGVPTSAPDGCQMTHVQLVGRHGERYPSKSLGKKLFSTWYKISNYTAASSNGSVSFLSEDYTFFIQDTNNLEKLTTPENILDPINPYTGEMDAKKHAREFLASYGDLMENCTTFPVFCTSSRRVHDTAQFFIDALGDDFNATLEVISEEPSAGANTIAALNSCPAWNESTYSNVTDSYSDDYLQEISSRLNNDNKGLNLTSDDAYNLFSWCAFEINVRGYSDVCNVFTPEELVHFQYYDDLTSYYQMGPGYPIIQSVGANLLNASVKLLKESDTAQQKAWMSFTHDTDIVNYMTTIGLFDNGEQLDPSGVTFVNNIYHKSWMTPQGARLYTQKYQCSNESYVRYVLNDKVIPLMSCSDGPGFSCPINEFYDYAEGRMNGTNFYNDCEVQQVSNTTELTFYWDYKNTTYNATLLDQ